jgi:hypothetical protein
MNCQLVTYSHQHGHAVRRRQYLGDGEKAVACAGGGS